MRLLTFCGGSVARSDVISRLRRGTSRRVRPTEVAATPPWNVDSMLLMTKRELFLQQTDLLEFVTIMAVLDSQTITPHTVLDLSLHYPITTLIRSTDRFNPVSALWVALHVLCHNCHA